MPDTVRHPTALISWAHADVSWSDSTIAARQDAVLRLSAALRDAGIDAELDLHHLSEGVDWTRWGPAKAGEADFVLVVVSQRWRSAWEGSGDPTKGAGSAAEADALRSLYTRNRDEFLNKVRIVMLPGAADGDIPDGLHGVPRFRIDTFDAAGIEELLRSLTAQAKFPKAPLGPLPVLPPTPAPGHGEDERVRLESALEALPVPTDQDTRESAWYRERERTETLLHNLDATPVAARSASAGERLSYAALPHPVSIEWKSDFDPSPNSRALLSVHVVPVPARPLAARQLSQVAADLPHRVRGPGLLDPKPALKVSDTAAAVAISLADAVGHDRDRQAPALQGVRVARDGQVSAWTTLPADGMGTLIDEESLRIAIHDCLGLAAAAGVPVHSRVAIGVEVGPVLMVNIGPASALGRSQATLNALGGPENLRVEPDETVDGLALSDHRAEAAVTLSDLTLRTWRQHFRS